MIRINLTIEDILILRVEKEIAYDSASQNYATRKNDHANGL